MSKMHENPFPGLTDDEIISESVDAMTKATLATCATIAGLLEGDTGPSTLASKVIVKILIVLARAAKVDSVNLAMGHDKDTWKAHIHYGYLDADPKHVLDFTAQD